MAEIPHVARLQDAVTAVERMLEDYARTRSRPGLRLDVRADQSVYLRRDLERGDLDLALLKRDAGEKGGIAVWPERVHWVTSKTDPIDPQIKSVPLIFFPSGCLYRTRAIHAIETTGRAWHMAYTSSSLSGIQAAVAAGPVSYTHLDVYKRQSRCRGADDGGDPSCRPPAGRGHRRRAHARGLCAHPLAPRPAAGRARRPERLSAARSRARRPRSRAAQARCRRKRRHRGVAGASALGDQQDRSHRSADQIRATNLLPVRMPVPHPRHPRDRDHRPCLAHGVYQFITVGHSGGGRCGPCLLYTSRCV